MGLLKQSLEMSGMLGGGAARQRPRYGFRLSRPGEEPRPSLARRAVADRCRKRGCGGTELLAVAAVYPRAGAPSVFVPVAMRAALSTDAPKLVRHVQVMFK